MEINNIEYEIEDLEHDLIRINSNYQEVSDMILAIAENCDGKLVKTEWRSKYNSYVLYNYEPFAKDGFVKLYMIQFKNKDLLNYFKFVLEQRVDKVKQLELALLNTEVN